MNRPNLSYADSVIPDSAYSNARTRHELEAHFVSDDNMPPLHGDLYEQIDQLEAIDVDELVKLLADDNNVTTLREPVSLADFFEGLAQLATMGVVEVTDIVEAIHREVILRPLGRFNEGNVNNWQRGITGRIYGTIRHIMLMVGNNLASVLRIYKRAIDQKAHDHCRIL